MGIVMTSGNLLPISLSGMISGIDFSPKEYGPKG